MAIHPHPSRNARRVDKFLDFSPSNSEIMATTLSQSGLNGYKPSYIPAAIAGTLVFVLYLITLAPSVAMWDTGEYMAAVKVLGLPHPPGNPFFMLLGKAFATLPIPVS